MPLVDHHPHLSAETHDLLSEAVTADDRRRDAIHDIVITSHLWLARSLARRFRGRGEDDDDLYQVACAGLVEAYERFDATSGEFAAFAAATVSGLLKRHLRDRAWMIRPSRPTQEACVAIRREWPRVAQELRREPDADDLARHLDLPLSMIRSAEGAGMNYSGVSLDALEGAAPADGGERVQQSEARMIISRLLATLDDGERRLLRLRFVDEWTQADIATELGTSQMQVSRLLSRLLARLRERLGDDSPSLAAA